MTTSILGGRRLVWLLTLAVVVVVQPWLAAGEITSVSVDCETSCGGVDIPFPFGMGPDKSCWLPGFHLSCKDVGNGVLKPFMAADDNQDHPTTTGVDVEVLNISLEQGEAQVLHPINSYCYNPASRTMLFSQWHWDLSYTPYTFSSTANKFTVVGCRALAYIGDTSGYNGSTMYLTGCVSMCFEGNMELSPCSGMGCCQTPIPKGLQYYQVWFDRSLFNNSRVDAMEGLFGACSFAVLMKDSYNFSWPNGDMGWSSSNFSNISTGFNTSLGGMAPVVLDWSIGQDNCTTAARNDPEGYACRSIHSSCFDSPTGRGYTCKCNQGFQGNPYLRNDHGGCQDINECLDQDKYPCFGDCTNNIGSFDCRCSPGIQGNASIPGGCQQEPFPRGARMALGVSVGVFVPLLAFLSTQVFLNKESKKRQRYFEQHGGRMLSRILETDGNITFKLYDRGDLVKATNGFHKRNIVGEGAHGTVYKATIGDSTVAVKRCKQIDESRTSEFVQELVVLCRVNHPNIVKLLGCCLHFEAPMLVYEFMPNRTLSDLLYSKPRCHLYRKSQCQVTLPTRLRIAAETAEALAHLHSPPHPTLHGDVKPQNILLGVRYVAKVSDFGCSTINDNVQVVPKGTLAYLDPEFLKDFQIAEKTDVYSLGVVLIELLTGKNPQAKEWKNLTTMFQSSMGNGTLGDLLDADIVVEEGSTELICAVAQLVSQCIAVPGNTRPAMGEVAVELRRFSDQMPESPEAQAALGVEDDGRKYSYTATRGQTTKGIYDLHALSTELAR